MVCQKTVYKLNISIPKEFDHLCNRYTNSKFHCLSLFKLSISQHSKIELFIIDLTEPIFVFTQNRYLYILVVVKLSCYYTIVCLLEDKKRLVSLFKILWL